MAAAKPKTEKKAKGGISLAVIIILTLLSAGAGIGFGFMSESFMVVVPPNAAGDAGEHKSDVASAIAIKPMPAITANLARPGNTWIRLESSIVVKKDLGPEGDVIASRMSEDIVAFLRTLTVDQISGPSGFQHLREDLNDRVRVRSEGKVSELIIQSMILE
jgi:flagellar protein FliL